MANMDIVFNLKEVVFSVLFVSGDGIEKPFLAEKLEISVKHLSTLETGKGFVSAELLEKICDVLSITPSALFYTPEEKSLDNSVLSNIDYIIEEELKNSVLNTKKRIHNLTSTRS